MSRRLTPPLAVLLLTPQLTLLFFSSTLLTPAQGCNDGVDRITTHDSCFFLLTLLANIYHLNFRKIYNLPTRVSSTNTNHHQLLLCGTTFLPSFYCLSSASSVLSLFLFGCPLFRYNENIIVDTLFHLCQELPLNTTYCSFKRQ